MKIGLSSMIRDRWMVVCTCSGSLNGASTGTIHGARNHMIAERATSEMTIAFITLDATRHASSSRSFAR